MFSLSRTAPGSPLAANGASTSDPSCSRANHASPRIEANSSEREDAGVNGVVDGEDVLQAIEGGGHQLAAEDVLLEAVSRSRAAADTDLVRA
jgi:hypothetical protein